MNTLARRDTNQGGMIQPWSYFDDLFDDFSYPFSNLGLYSPVTEENEKDYVCEFDMPGLDKEDIDITIDKGFMSIKGEKKDGRRSRVYQESIR